MPNFTVSLAELIIPAADLSEQISTAGTEASGTGNMKLALNGAITIGTLDGANVEIREQVGDDNIFIFGHTTAEVADIRAAADQPRNCYERDPQLAAALDAIRDGLFSPGEPGRYQAVFDALMNWGDHYLLLADFASYVEAQAECRRVLSRLAAMDPVSPAQHRRHGPLFVRSHDRRVRAHDLAHRAAGMGSPGGL